MYIYINIHFDINIFNRLKDIWVKKCIGSNS